MRIGARDVLGQAVHAVYLNGNIVKNVRECETGPRGYVVFLDETLGQNPDGSWVECTCYGEVTVRFLDGTVVE